MSHHSPSQFSRLQELETLYILCIFLHRFYYGTYFFYYFFFWNNCISYSFGVFLKIMNTMDKYVMLPSLDHVIGYLSFLGCFEILIASKSKRILWLDESHQHCNIYLGILKFFFFTSSSNLKCVLYGLTFLSVMHLILTVIFFFCKYVFLYCMCLYLFVLLFPEKYSLTLLTN